MWLRSVAPLASLLIFLSTFAYGAGVLDKVSGTYKVPAVRCSTMEGKGLLTPCSRETLDCLTIRKESSDTAWIQFSSTQTNGHECSDEGIAKLVDGALRFCPANPEYGKQCVRIEIGKARLVMTLLGGEGKRDAFCGARATVKGLSFPRTTREKADRCYG